MADPLRLYGLKAVVLAGASGIGEATARTLVKHGSEVLALDTEASGIDTVYTGVKGISGAALDASAADYGDAVAAAAKSYFGGADILVNYVELPQDGPVSDNDEPALERLLEARDRLYDSVAAATIPMLKRSPAGRIISIGFVRSVFSIDGERAYEKSIEALADYCRHLAVEHGEDGVYANYIQPGAIMTRESRPVFSASTELRDFCIRRSAARRLGETIDVAKVVLFLASDDSAFVNGSGVIVDGGRAADD